jgi:hypothetical protein
MKIDLWHAIVGLFAWVGVLTLLYVMYLFAYDPTRLVILFW